MKKTLLPIVAILAFATLFACHHRAKDHDHDHDEGPGIRAGQHWDCTDAGTHIHRKPTSPGSTTDDSCDTDWDLAYYANHPGSETHSHDEIGFGGTSQDVHGKPRHDKLKLSHSMSWDFSYCVRPVIPGQPMGNSPAQSCTPAPSSLDSACNLYPFEDANNGDSDATQFKPVHQLKVVDLASPKHDCHYKLTFFVKNKKTGKTDVIDPHIVIGSGGT